MILQVCKMFGSFSRFAFRKKWIVIFLGFNGILMKLAFGQIGNGSFKIVLLPDTDISPTAEVYPAIYRAQTNWIVANSDSIAFVLHQGDITHSNSEKEWEQAVSFMSVLDGKVPYAVCIGNHDMGVGGAAESRDTDLFNKWFSYGRYRVTKNFRGSFEDGKMDNTWYTFDAGGFKWLVLSLEFGPRSSVLDWACHVVETHPHHKIIINTHAYMYSDDTRMSSNRQHRWLPQQYGVGKHFGVDEVNDGEEMWAKLVSRYQNIMFVFSGHVLNGGVGTLVSKGKEGNKVDQLLANFQDGVEGSTNGGNGFLRIMTIDPVRGQVSIQTYSPYLNKFNTESMHQFVFEDVIF